MIKLLAVLNSNAALLEFRRPYAGMGMLCALAFQKARRLLMELSAEHFLKTEDIQDEAGNKEA